MVVATPYRMYNKEEWLKSAREMLETIERAGDLLPSTMIGVTTSHLAWDLEEYTKMVEKIGVPPTETTEDDETVSSFFRFGPHTLIIFYVRKKAA